MFLITENKLKQMLVDKEGVTLKSGISLQNNPSTLYTVADIQNGRFRRLFDRHRNAYKLFN
jgi:Flp pilus assembly CpaE family ATPase